MQVRGEGVWPKAYIYCFSDTTLFVKIGTRGMGVKNLAYVMLRSYIYVDTLYGWFCDIEFGWDFFEALHLTENVEKTCRLRGIWK